MENQAVLVTGGAGYIGSHVVKQLINEKYKVVVLDNLSTGFRAAAGKAEFIDGNTGDEVLVTDILKSYNINSVLHFAAHTIVPESVSNPLKYYSNNTVSTFHLLKCCQNCGVKNFIFSSTAAVYGIPKDGTAAEDTLTNPINPYGASKLMSEQMLRDLTKASELNCVILRYFNVAGSDPEGEIGQSTAKATLLIKVAVEVALGKRPHLSVFGTDYPTPDGTGVRDYIHVSDLADAHIKALEYLNAGGESTLLNCGYGRGYSVREVIEAVERVHGSPIEVKFEPRRAGDPPSLVAQTDRIRNTLPWTPKYDDLDLIVKTALNWEKNKLY